MSDATEIAEGRRKQIASTRELSEGYEEVGVLGELAFAKIAGLEIDSNSYKGGDNGVDFVVPLTIDVKTARKPFNLIVEEGKVKSLVYILYGMAEEPYPVGWEWGVNVKNAPTKDFGYGVVNHYIPAQQLRPINELLILLELALIEPKVVEEPIEEMLERIFPDEIN